jgi:hypothetical protein
LNAHHLTADAQSALRRCIELFSYNTRFFIVVENKNKLLTPILSRFCEIYVPEHEDAGVPTNLHTYMLDQTCPFRAALQQSQRTRITDILSENSTNNVVVLADRLYEAGISCLDLIGWVNGPEVSEWKMPDVDYAQMMMHFHTIKTEFRCEKLLMLRILSAFPVGDVVPVTASTQKII